MISISLQHLPRNPVKTERTPKTLDQPTNQPTNQPTTWSIPYPSPTNQPTPSLKARLLETFFDQTSFNFTIAQILQNQWKLALLMRKPRKSPPKWTNCDPFFLVVQYVKTDLNE